MEQQNTDYLGRLRAIIAVGADAVRRARGQQPQYRVVNGKVIGASNRVTGFLVSNANEVLPDFIVDWMGSRAKQVNAARNRDRAQSVARQVGEQISALFYVAIADDMTRMGFGPLLGMLSGEGWLEWAGSERAKTEATRLKRDARALAKWKVQGPGAALDGEAWRALNLYMEQAYPIHIINPVPPPSITETDDWRALVQAWPDLNNSRPAVGAIAHLTQHRQTPYADRGAAKMRSLYSVELGYLEGGAGLSSRVQPGLHIDLGGRQPNPAQQGKTPAQQAAERQRQAAARQEGKQPRSTVQKVPSWPSKELPGGAASVIGPDGYYSMSVTQRVEWFTSRGYPGEYAYPTDGEQRYRARINAKKKGGNGLLWGVGGALVFGGGGLLLRHRRNRT